MLDVKVGQAPTSTWRRRRSVLLKRCGSLYLDFFVYKSVVSQVVGLGKLQRTHLQDTEHPVLPFECGAASEVVAEMENVGEVFV
jgi:hypothetical protein